MNELCKARCLACGAVIVLDINGDWRCPACGAYDGNGHIEWIEEGEIKNGGAIDLCDFPERFL